MDLLGVSVVGRINTASNGRRYFKFINPIDGSILSSSNYKKKLNKLGYTFYDIVMKLNDISYEDIPSCPVCGSRVRISGDIITPKFHPTCGKVFCGQSYANRIKMQNGWMPPSKHNLSDKQLSDRARKAAKTQKKNGTFMLDNESAEDKFTRFSKINKTKWRKGNHPQIGAGWVEVEVGGRIYKFRSKAEASVFKRYTRFILKYYDFEKKSCSYYLENELRSYYGDFNLKPEYSNLDLPDVIEVKSFNILHDHRSKRSSIINYSKFLGLLNSGKTLLIIDHQISRNIFHKIYSINELNSLFKKKEGNYD